MRVKGYGKLSFTLLKILMLLAFLTNEASSPFLKGRRVKAGVGLLLVIKVNIRKNSFIFGMIVEEFYLNSY